MLDSVLTVYRQKKQRRGLLEQVQREDLCLSPHASFRSHLFLSLFLFSLSVFETLSLSDTLYFICNNTISQETRSWSRMLII